MTANVKERLEYLRAQIQAESISWGEIAELQGLADEIEPGDVELLEWAGAPEFPDIDEEFPIWKATDDRDYRESERQEQERRP